MGPMYKKEASSPASAQDERKLILSVDNQLNLLNARYKLLSAAGYAVLSASDGAEALEIFGSKPVDLVVLDYVLQGMDGGLLADAMKAHRPNVPIVLVSGAEVPQECLAIVNAFVRKGDGPEPLLKAIRQLTRRHPDSSPGDPLVELRRQLCI